MQNAVACVLTGNQDQKLYFSHFGFLALATYEIKNRIEMLVSYHLNPV